MPTFNIYIPLVFLFIIITFPSLKTEAAPEYRYHICSNTSTYSPNSTYQSNLNLVLSSLSSNATNVNGFYNVTVGRDRQDTVYGLFLCRGDVTADVCQDCVATATSEILSQQYCPKEKTAIIWYDYCMLRYDNQSFFSVMEYSPYVLLTNTQNVTEQSRFNQIVYDTMDNISTRAANDQSGKKFATGEANFTAPYNNIYNLVQCTPDISAADCNRCLQTAVAALPNCCSGKQGGNVLLPSCNIRYEVYQFYSILAAAPAPTTPVLISPSSSSNTGKIIAIVVPIAAIVVIIFTLCYCCLRRKTKTKYDAVKEDSAVVDMSTPESLQFDLSTIQAATNNFSDENKIGEGGFGDVYKGILSNGQLIAVKRLSRSSGQGAEEFKNEAVLVAKLQHRNLVRLLGFCLEGEEKILVYEFVPNKSLDDFLFDSEKRGQLNWSRRYKIIQGIARGILYLHEDSRLRIIHRDLKASNILLDGDMNPKISDFGMARIFGVDQTQGNTNRIVGTYGYMSPEYAMQGQFSVKSDVYSFGVLVLEIISGKKNSTFYQSDCAEDLLSHAWKLWRDGSPLEFIDPTLKTSYARDEVIRCIHIGLLCVQEDVDDRPTMASIGLMLTSLSTSLQLPQQPAFFVRTRTGSSMPIKDLESDQSASKSIPWSVNEVSITELYPR